MKIRSVVGGDFGYTKLQISWRIVWYAALVWFLGLIIGGIVIIPWFYPVMAIVVLITTVYYFKIANPLAVRRGRKGKLERDRLLAIGLVVAILWFLIIGILSVFEIAQFYYFDFIFYFSDLRNWYIFSLVLLIPIVYSLILENVKLNRRLRRFK